MEYLMKIYEFLQSELMTVIGVSLFMLVEYWLGQTNLIKPGSTLEMILLSVKKVLEVLKLKKPAS